MTTRIRSSRASTSRSRTSVPFPRATTTVNRPRRRTSRPNPDVDQRAETLAEFAAVLSQHAGKPVPFMASVVELAQTRATIKAIKARRTLIFEQIKARYAGGTTITSDGSWELRATRPTELITVRTVDSDTVKRAYPNTWHAARLVVPRVSITPPKTYDVVISTPRLPVVPRPADNLDRCVSAYKHRAFDHLERLRHDENVLIGRLEAIADDFGWDGLPMAFTDGWKVGLRSLRFDAERLAEIAPDVFDELAVDKLYGGSSRVYLARPGDDELSEVTELDGE